MKKINEVYENNQAMLPRDYIENSHDMTTAGIEESNPNLPAFVCPICESAPMADELIYVPDGEKVIVKAMSIQGDKEVALEYDIYLAEEIRPFLKIIFINNTKEPTRGSLSLTYDTITPLVSNIFVPSLYHFLNTLV